MSAELRRARARYAAAREEATRLAAQSVKDMFGADFRIGDWSRSAQEAYNQHWCGIERHPDGGFDWPEIFRRFRDPDVLRLVMWSGDDLGGLGLATVGGTYVKLRFLEGDPRSENSLKGMRVPIAVETCAFYAQALDRSEIRVEQVAEGTKTIYIEGYGFCEVTPKRELPYLKKDV